MSADERRRFILFLGAGSAAALVNIASRVVLNWAMPYEVAIVVAYLIGMTTAYLLNRYFVFAASGRGVTSEYLRFTLVNLAAVAQVWVVSVALARLAFPAAGFDWHADTVAHVIGVAVPVLTSYLGHKHFSFAARV
ncbi:MAG TPA: GtrA family protein [Xanthobacteraceae bacterium]|nr:GtrA family protein [Xanthobacteraceae bacterium]